MASNNLEKAFEAAETLSLEDLHALHERIETRLYGEQIPEDELDAEIAETIRQRNADLESGKTRTFSAAEVEEKLKARYGD